MKGNYFVANHWQLVSDRESINSYPPIFSANLEEISLVFSLLSVALPLVLDHPPSLVYPGFEDT
jgi:hypothetical protein